MLCKYFTKYKYRRKKIVEKNQKCRQLYRSVTIINFATERKRLFFFLEFIILLNCRVEEG